MEKKIFSIEVRIIGRPNNVEGAFSCQHFVEEHPQGPPVDAEAVLGALQNLGGNVVGGAAEGGGGVPGPDPLLAHAIVGELDVPLVVQQHVV